VRVGRGAAAEELQWFDRADLMPRSGRDKDGITRFHLAGFAVDFHETGAGKQVIEFLTELMVMPLCFASGGERGFRQALIGYRCIGQVQQAADRGTVLGGERGLLLAVADFHARKENTKPARDQESAFPFGVPCSLRSESRIHAVLYWLGKKIAVGPAAEAPGQTLFFGCGDMPRRGVGARGTQACLICPHVILPELALLNIGGTEFPVLCRIINAFEKTRALFVVRLVEEELDDPCANAVEMLLQIHDGTVSFVPQVFRIEQLSRKSLATKNLGMHADDEHVLVIGAIENADAPAFRQATVRAPEEVMFQLLGAGLFETENLAALRIDPGHDMADGTVLAGGIHPLENEQQGIGVGCIVQTLQ